MKVADRSEHFDEWKSGLKVEMNSTFLVNALIAWYRNRISQSDFFIYTCSTFKMAAFYEDEMEEDQQTFDEHENNYMNESRSMISRMIESYLRPS